MTTVSFNSLTRHRVAALLLCWWYGCSVSEGANTGTRCSSSVLCPLEEVCYRGFCIAIEPLPALDLDAGSLGTPTGSTSRDASEAGAGLLGGDASGGLSGLDSAIESTPSSGLDAAAIAPDGRTTVPPVPDSTQPGDGGPASDASVAPTDDGSPGASSLAVCLGYCVLLGPVCSGCVSTVLTVTPNACSARAQVDPMVRRLCEPVCTASPCKN